MRKTLCILAIAAALPGQAHAHVGHVGDLAGHSHWIGLAALGVAAGLLALLPKGKRGEEQEMGEQAAGEGETQEPEGAEA
jgi:hypothetical protein